jgi:hypothetical protein
MAEDRNARPVSGEIMAGPATPERPEIMASRDIVDAEFETVDRPAGHLGSEASASPEVIGTVTSPTQGMSVLKSSGDQPRPEVGSRRGGPLFWVFGMVLIAGAFWVSGGHALMRPDAAPAAIEPATSSTSLRIEGLTYRVERAGDRTVLFVDGDAVNDGALPASMPALEITVISGEGRVTRYKLGTSARELPAGGRFSFSTRLEAPTDGVKSVTADFIDEGT